MEASTWVPALLIVIGMVGIVVPVIPGLILCLGAVLLWAWDTGGALAWWVRRRGWRAGRVPRE